MPDPKSPEKTLEPWKEYLQAQKRTIFSALGGSEGEKLMKVLRDTFQRGKLFDENAIKMARNCGQYELVEYLNEMLEASKKDE